MAEFLIFETLYYQAPGSSTPVLCRYTGYFTNNTAPAHTFGVSGPSWGSEPCGAGNYQMNANVWVSTSSTGYQWKGGAVPSGYLWD
jgi:hypothetical protein